MSAPLPRSIEPLEPRIAPANLVISNLGKTAKWTDVDGDLVTLTSTKPLFDEFDFTFLPQETGDLGFQLALLDLSDDAAQGASLTFAAKRDPVAKVGDGFVNVGWINAQGSDLTAIIVPGDLARLDVGDNNPANTALGSITVFTAGLLGDLTQGTSIAGGDPTVDWTAFGRVGTVTVKGDFAANLNVLGTNPAPSLGSLGTINILGNLRPNDPALTDSTMFPDKGTGYLFTTGAIGTVKIAGDLIGGSSKASGSIISLANIGSITIGGSVSGGAADFAGYIFSGGVMGTVKVAGDILGSAGNFSGSIVTSSSITSVTVRGSLSGNSGDRSGQIFADGTLGSVSIGGNLISGIARDVEGTLTPSFASGSIGAGVKVAKVTVLGSVFGGASVFGGSIYNPGGSGGSIGTVTINGTLSGGTEFIDTGEDGTLIVFNGIYSDSTMGAVKVGALQGRTPVNPVHIVAKGLLLPSNATQAQALTIASLTVLRGMDSAEVLAGYNQILEPSASDVQIGPVKVGNNVVGSSIAAGIARGADFFFGTDDDVTTASINPQDRAAIRSKITSITVGGYLFGNVFGDDSFAFQAEEIGAVKIGATVLPMTVRSALNGPDDFLLGVTRDFRIREL